MKHMLCCVAALAMLYAPTFPASNGGNHPTTPHTDDMKYYGITKLEFENEKKNGMS